MRGEKEGSREKGREEQEKDGGNARKVNRESRERRREESEGVEKREGVREEEVKDECKRKE